MRLLFSVLILMFSLLNVSGAAAQTLRQMAGQMIVIGFPHSSTNAKGHSKLVGLVKNGDIGGVMYLKFNVSKLSTVTKMNQSFLSAGAAYPPIIAIDQEGGVVERLTKSVGFKEIPRASEVASSYSVAKAKALYADLGLRMSKLGFNTNFGPVVDVNTNSNNPIIAKYGRAFSKDAEKVTQYAEAFIDGHHQSNMLTALKHFPGHGSSAADSHLGFVDISDTWQQLEYTPYVSLIGGSKADMVMAGHLYHSGFIKAGGKQVPASLSTVALTDVLRKGMGFQGVVISDDMEMGAITKHYGFEEAIIRAVKAGNDILLFSNTVKPSLDLPSKILNVMEAEAARDPAFARRIEESFSRIVKMKSRL